MSIYRGLGLAAATAVILIIGAPVAGADRDHDGRGYWRNGGHGRGHGYSLDHREEHNHHSPQHGAEARIPPRGYGLIPHRGINYYFSSGVWYRSQGPRFAVVMPPIGVVVPVLPPFYITVSAGGIPSYYARGVYYVWNRSRHGYVISARPFNK